MVQIISLRSKHEVLKFLCGWSSTKADRKRKKIERLRRREGRRHNVGH